MTLVVAVPSFMGPKSCAMKTLDRAASTQLCASNISPQTSNLTSAPTWV
jgi:hypothetical protein